MRSEDAPRRLQSLPTWLMNQAALPGQRLVGEELAVVGARRPHYSVLAALDEFGPDSQAELGRRVGIDRSDMVAVLNELVDAGYVERRADPTDARRNRVTITAAGRRRLRKLDTLVGRGQERLLAPLSASERTELTRLLRVVVDHHAEHSPS